MLSRLRARLVSGFAAVESVTPQVTNTPAFQPSRWSGDKGYFSTCDTPSRPEPCPGSRIAPKRLCRAPILLQSRRGNPRNLGSQWENSLRQHERAIAKRSPTHPPPTVGGVATGLTPTAPYLPAKLSMPRAATSAASRCDTPTSVRESSNRANFQRSPSVFAV